MGPGSSTTAASAATPVWSPDGKSIAYGATRTAAGEGEIIRKPATGGAEELIARSGALGSQLRLFDWSPDGKTLAFTPEVSVGRSRADVILLPIEGDRKATPYIHTNFEEIQAQC